MRDEDSNHAVIHVDRPTAEYHRSLRSLRAPPGPTFKAGFLNNNERVSTDTCTSSGIGNKMFLVENTYIAARKTFDWWWQPLFTTGASGLAACGTVSSETHGLFLSATRYIHTLSCANYCAKVAPLIYTIRGPCTPGAANSNPNPNHRPPPNRFTYFIPYVSLRRKPRVVYCREQSVGFWFAGPKM